MNRRSMMLLLLASILVCTNSCGSGGPTVMTPSGLQYEVVVAGEGEVAGPGDSVRIHETTRLEDGTLIFSTRTNNRPVSFRIGAGHVITGVEEGVTGMKVGERRKLIVPPSLSKRTEQPPTIPKDAVLFYNIELLEILEE